MNLSILRWKFLLCGMYVDFVYYVLAKLKEPKNYLNFSARILLLASEKNLEIFSFRIDFFMSCLFHIFRTNFWNAQHSYKTHTFFGDTIFLELKKIEKKKRGQKGSLYKIFLSLLLCFDDEQY